MRYALSIIFGFIAICHAESFSSPSQSYQSKNVKSTIQQTLQEVNQNTPPSIYIELLKYCPEVIPVLADWIYEDWSPYDHALTKENLIESFNHKCTDDQLPFTLVAFRDSQPIGVISLKAHETAELADLENGNPWSGSLHVATQERGLGVGALLAKTLATIAKRLDYEEIRFYLSESKGVNWCTKRGAEILEMRPFRGHMITILRYKL